jgi:hypothetical protein
MIMMPDLIKQPSHQLQFTYTIITIFILQGSNGRWRNGEYV